MDSFLTTCELIVCVHKLKGLFTLIHTNMDDQDRDWLLIKKDDVFAVTHVYDAKKIPLYDEVFL